MSYFIGVFIGDAPLSTVNTFNNKSTYITSDRTTELTICTVKFN